MGAGRDYRVVLVGTVHGGERAELDNLLDRVMEELLRIDARDPSLEIDFSTAVVRVAISVGAANPLDATIEASTSIRCAIHAAGGGTPDWPAVDGPPWSVELTGVETGQLDPTGAEAGELVNT